MPVSKKRKKKRTKPTGPPPPKHAKPAKKKLTRQQILIYIFSALIIMSLAIGFIVGGRGRRSSPQSSDQPQNILLLTPAHETQEAMPEDATAPDTSPESTPEN